MANSKIEALVDYFPSRADDHLSGLMVIADHASNHLPKGLELGIDPAILETHRAVDLGTEKLSRKLHERRGCAVANACISRLVVDLNRFRDEPSTIPLESDGIAIPANVLDKEQHEKRLKRYYDGYHGHIARLIEKEKPQLIIFLHSFTPKLAKDSIQRPWHYGVMYDQDERAAHIALHYFAERNIIAGDQLPYSGKIYNSSFQRHAATHNIPYVGLEVRQDLLSDAKGIDNAANVVGGLAENILQIL